MGGQKNKWNREILAEASSGLGVTTVGISDIKGSQVNFRDREGGSSDGVPHKRKLTGSTETQLYGSSWEQRKKTAH